ncbi:indolepyruvate ferredoxin oxidoreductase [Sphingopyxis sp. Root1497]|uniref:indolepyruvate ferredoxin oxidoreductase family protein n=1 Tax=Sphingopyxis sp. Root1497 TaxID=1736474 RepID=UPI0006FD18EE|nr:indolepyruvate ferredoxin oxidoreductase family protein [Sphingopyxis sp. Root1497]KQZ61006.1 indolepyruvate ferredoxin oxidoreductase [Sphingopyxis sp. Root1497]
MIGTAISLDDKWTVTRGRILINGTQALVRVLLDQAQLDQRAGMTTAGYISGYRGSPLGNVDTTLWSVSQRLEAANVKFHPGVNEDLAATAVAGTQQLDQFPEPRYEGVFAAWYGKGPGVDRAGDAFKHGHYAGASAKGGVVLFYGDDHAGKSSTVSHQSEQAVAANAIPSFYPADPGEILHYGLMALALSRHSGLWAAVKCVTEVVEQTASVDVDLDAFAPALPAVSDVPPEGLHAAVRPYNPLRAEQIVTDHRLPLVIPFVRANGIDRVVFRAASPRLAIVSAGKSYGDARQALSLLGLDERGAAELGISLYKAGCIWPLDTESVADFARDHDVLLVIEEKKSFMEAQIASALVRDRHSPILVGKLDEDGAVLLSSVLPLEPADLARVISDRLSRLGLAAPLMPAPATADLQNGPGGELRRSPFFCSGCPHNRSTKIPEGSVSLTGIGCHTMANFVAPSKAMLPMQMGAEGTNWMGIAPFTGTRHVFQNMGDGTYYHSGLLAIRAAIASGVNITYKILYNDAVAMTGGQPVDGPLSVADIAQQVRHEGAKRIVVLSDNPDHHKRNGIFPDDVTIGHRDDLDTVQKQLRETPGCTVLIYEQTCAAEKRRRRKRGSFPDPAKRMYIAEDVCEGCGDCSVQSTCVSIMPKDTALGRKREIDQSSCNKDYSCADGFCPSFITVRGAEPRKTRGINIDEALFADLPDPARAAGDCNLMVAGIGGTGVITVGALIGMAAHLDGRAASLFDMTGLAQKNGAVFSHIRIASNPSGIHTQRLGHGEADLLLAFDMVAALSPEAASTLSRTRTHALANHAVAPTVAFQFDREALPEREGLEARLETRVSKDRLVFIDVSALALGLLGDTIAANLMMVGMAAQLGRLPVSIAALERAIELNGVAVQLNLKAFRLGRLYIADRDKIWAMLPGTDGRPRMPATLEEVVEHRAAYLTQYQDAALSDQFRAKVKAVEEAERKADRASTALALVFARNYARLLAVKDEYEVARMLSNPALHARLADTFEDGARLSFNMAPPILPGRAPNGRPRKREFPVKPTLPLLRGLAAMKWLRRSKLDPLRLFEERRNERRMIRDYEMLVDRLLPQLTAGNLQSAAALLDRISSVRGYGPVKEAARQIYVREVEDAERQFGQAANAGR